MSDMVNMQDTTLGGVITVPKEHAETVLMKQGRYVLIDEESTKEKIEVIEDKKEIDLDKVSPILNVSPPKVEEKAKKKRGRPKKKTS